MSVTSEMSDIINTISDGSSYTLEKLLGLKSEDNLKLAEKVEAGFSFDTFERLGKYTGVPLDKLRVAIRITPRTLTRRRKEKRLSPEESDRLVSVSRLLANALELFEGQQGSNSTLVHGS